jgi:hypothetical protein
MGSQRTDLVIVTTPSLAAQKVASEMPRIDCHRTRI